VQSNWEDYSTDCQTHLYMRKAAATAAPLTSLATLSPGGMPVSYMWKAATAVDEHTQCCCNSTERI